MSRCALCKNPIVGDQSITARRKDGSKATLCMDCGAKLKQKLSQEEVETNPTQAVPIEKTPSKNERKQGDKWYQTMGVGFLCLVFGVLVYIQLSRLELGEVSSVRLWWPVAVLYKMLGFWGAIGFMGLLALIFLGFGFKQLIDEVNE